MTLCNLNIEMGGRSGFVAPDDSTFAWLEGRPYGAAGRHVGSCARPLAHAHDGRRRRVRPRGHARSRRARTADHLGYEPGAGPPASSVTFLQRAAQAGLDEAIWQRALRLYGSAPWRPSRRHQDWIASPSVPAPTRGSRTSRAAARVAVGRKVAAHVKAVVVPGLHAPSRGKRGGQRGLCAIFLSSLTPDFFGASRGVPCARVAAARRSRPASASSPRPTEISRVGKAPACARIWRARRRSQRARSPDASPTCGSWSAAVTCMSRKSGHRFSDKDMRKRKNLGAIRPNATVHKPYRYRCAAPGRRHEHRSDRAVPAVAQSQGRLQGDAVSSPAASRRYGSEIADFVLNKPQFRNAGILVTGNNFGAGSSREIPRSGACSATISVSLSPRASPISIARIACRTGYCRSCSTRPVPMPSSTARVVAADGAAPFTVDLVTAAHSLGPGGSAIRGLSANPCRGPHARWSKASMISA